MDIAAILSLLQAVPSIFAAAAAVRDDLSIDDQSKLDIAIAAAKAGALAAVTQADTDLGAAANL